MSTLELITLIANIALTLSFIIALVFGIAQVQTAARDRKERLTLETLRAFQTREFAETALFVSRHTMPQNAQEMSKTPMEDQVKIFQFAQMMESLGMMVAERYITLDLVDKTLGGFIAQTWEKYEPLFTDIRVNQPDPFLGEYFQWLAEHIDQRMRDKPREPFHVAGVSGKL